VICGAIAHSRQGWPAVTSIGNDSEYGWWLFPLLLFMVKIFQARIVDYHVGNLEIADRTLYSEDPTNFWEGP
jgi:hypothetical protein